MPGELYAGLPAAGGAVNNNRMKLLTILPFAAITLGAVNIRAADSAYGNAYLVLTSSNENELATANANSSAGYADAKAQPGLLNNSILTMGSTGGALSLEDESVSGFSDRLTINSPGLTGSSGSLQFHFLVSGTEAFSATAPGASSITAIADFAGPSGLTDDLQFTKESNGATIGTNFLDVPEMVIVPFTFGDPFTISLDIDFQAYADDLSGGGAASSSGTFSTTASTSNVMALVEGAEVPATNYSAHSASGANYFTILPIPEPAGIRLAAFSTLALLAMWRRKPARQP